MFEKYQGYNKKPPKWVCRLVGVLIVVPIITGVWLLLWILVWTAITYVTLDMLRGAGAVLGIVGFFWGTLRICQAVGEDTLQNVPEFLATPPWLKKLSSISLRRKKFKAVV